MQTVDVFELLFDGCNNNTSKNLRYMYTQEFFLK